MGLIKKTEKFPRKVKDTYNAVAMERFGLDQKDVSLIKQLKRNKRRS